MDDETIRGRTVSVPVSPQKVPPLNFKMSNESSDEDMINIPKSAILQPKNEKVPAIPLLTKENSMPEMEKKFTFKSLFSPRRKSKNSVVNVETKASSSKDEKKDGAIEKIKRKLSRTTSKSTRDKLLAEFQISAPEGYSRAFYVTQNLNWEFSDKSELVFEKKLGEGFVYG